MKKQHDKGHTIDEKEETVFDIYILLIGCSFIILFGAWFHRFFYNMIPSSVFPLSLFNLIAFPLVMFTYFIFNQINSIREHKTYDELLAEAKHEVEIEQKISGVIPVILFGVGIVYANIQKITPQKMHILKIVAPYLIFSLLFGTVMPNIVSYLILDHHDLHRVLVAADVDFVAVSISFGLMITSLLMPFFLLYSK